MENDFSTYLHINNGGITFDFDYDLKKSALIIKVHASHFGIKTNKMVVPTDRDSIKQLSDNILKFLEYTKDLDLEYNCEIAGIHE